MVGVMRCEKMGVGPTYLPIMPYNDTRMKN